MTKRRKSEYSEKAVIKSLDLADRCIEEGKLDYALSALRMGLDNVKNYDGQMKDVYLERIQERGRVLEDSGVFKDYEFDDLKELDVLAERMKNHPIDDVPRGSLTKFLPLFIGGVGLIAGLFFLSYNFTGNVVGTNSTSNILGIGLIICGLVGAGFYFKKK